MNYTRVAEQLCLTRPAVSHHIHRLEDRYGRRLFSYRGKALRLTETGIHPFFALQ
nr:LysR family transcriptional regulator [Pseudoflavonifractor phocaeensis]